MVARMCIAPRTPLPDKFDMLSPAYDYPQTAGEFRSWYQTAELTDIEVVWGIRFREIGGNSLQCAIDSSAVFCCPTHAQEFQGT